MAIKINKVDVIGNDRNLCNVGILTVGAGSSMTDIDSNANFTVGVGVTFNGVAGNISIAATITAGSLSVPLSVG
tara:strand:+ start:119 stop:340 length:222 start_codon:yes stop_codon:yes gene_type:complete